jgi:hypothetical protein
MVGQRVACSKNDQDPHLAYLILIATTHKDILRPPRQSARTLDNESMQGFSNP